MDDWTFERTNVEYLNTFTNILTLGLNANLFRKVEEVLQGKWISYKGVKFPLSVVPCDDMDDLHSINSFIAIVDCQSLTDQDWINCSDHTDLLRCTRKSQPLGCFAIMTKNPRNSDGVLHVNKLIDFEDLHRKGYLETKIGYELAFREIENNLT